MGSAEYVSGRKSPDSTTGLPNHLVESPDQAARRGMRGSSGGDAVDKSAASTAGLSLIHI